MMNPQSAWQAALGQLQMEMPKANFDTWVRSTELINYEKNTLYSWCSKCLCPRLARNTPDQHGFTHSYRIDGFQSIGTFYRLAEEY